MRGDGPLTDARILVVDDQEANVRLLERLLARPAKRTRPLPARKPKLRKRKAARS